MSQARGEGYFKENILSLPVIRGTGTEKQVLSAGLTNIPLALREILIFCPLINLSVKRTS